MKVIKTIKDKILFAYQLVAAITLVVLIAAAPFVKSKCTKSKNIFYEARMRAISSRKSCSEHR